MAVSPKSPVMVDKDHFRIVMRGLADELSQKIEGSSPLFCMLKGPASLVALQRGEGKSFKRSPHIGGEYFFLSGCHMGTRGKMIFQFIPREAADYVLVEMTSEEACKLLTNFEHWFNHESIRDLRKKAEAVLRGDYEKAVFAENTSIYPVFGDW